LHGGRRSATSGSPAALLKKHQRRRQARERDGQARDLPEDREKAEEVQGSVLRQEERRVPDDGGERAKCHGGSGGPHRCQDVPLAVHLVPADDVHRVVDADSQRDGEGDEVRKVDPDPEEVGRAGEPEKPDEQRRHHIHGRPAEPEKRDDHHDHARKRDDARARPVVQDGLRDVRREGNGPCDAWGMTARRGVSRHVA
jgi:hypothetical protein